MTPQLAAGYVVKAYKGTVNRYEISSEWDADEQC